MPPEAAIGARLRAIRRALASDRKCSLPLFLRGQREPGRLLCKHEPGRERCLDVLLAGKALTAADFRSDRR
jgi:hypothetical protein